MIPTKLYIKRHSKTGMMYFGKTVSKNINTYCGSGKRWLNHINHHGIDCVDTVWVREFDNINELQEFALAFSEIFDIVDSPLWANLQEENGLDGAPPGVPLSEDHRKKLSIAKIGKKRDPYISTLTPEGIEKRAEGLRGRVRSHEECAAISRGKKGKPLSESHKAKLSEAAKRRSRKPHSEETKRKLSQAAKDRNNNDILHEKENTK